MVQGQLGDAQAYTTSSQIYMGTHDPEYVLGLPGVLSLPSNFHHEPMVPPLSDIAMSWENFLSQFNI
jgi:hypothetical protein